MFIPEALLEGFLLSIGLIIAIGSQNIFVLKYGLKGKYNFTIALTCTICDFLLICLGSMGLGSFIAEIVWLRQIAIWGGAIFLIYFGLKSWLAILKGNLSTHQIAETSTEPDTLKTVILTALGFSLLNPHAFLDTVVLIGGISSRFDGFHARLLFTLGAGIASAVWFFSLSYGSRLLRPLFQKKTAAATFEFTSGSVMFWIAWGLVQPELLLLLA